jgi:cytidine deaminase
MVKAKRLGKSTKPDSPLRLLQHAKEAAYNAYAPYSEFAVGAAVETEDGRIFTGANMENASFGLTLCAEAGALQAASTAGALNLVSRIAVVGGPIRQQKTGRKPSPVAPCGRCRQLLQESAMLSGRDIRVWCADLNLKKRSTSRISKLLPQSFGAKDLPALSNWPILARLLRRRAR